MTLQQSGLLRYYGSGTSYADEVANLVQSEKYYLLTLLGEGYHV